MDNVILAKWNELKTIVEALEVDVVKNTEKGVAAAGVRVRKGLRQLQKTARGIVKDTLEADKAHKADK